MKNKKLIFGTGEVVEEAAVEGEIVAGKAVTGAERAAISTEKALTKTAERGAKLDNTVLKSGQMADHASDMLKQATQLKEQQQKSIWNF